MKKKPTPPPKKVPKGPKPPAPPPTKNKPATKPAPKVVPKPSTKAKAKTPAKKRAAGGAVSTATLMVTADKRTTIPPGATVLMSDAEYGGAVIEGLKERIKPSDIANIFEDLVKHSTYENKFGEEKTDYKTRLAALEKFMHTTVGKPLERIQNVTTTTYSYEELEKLIEHSGELRRALREMLRPFDGEDGVGIAKGKGRP